jgi:hypothetical protein
MVRNKLKRLVRNRLKRLFIHAPTYTQITRVRRHTNAHTHILKQHKPALKRSRGVLV